jgi:hypothetical protein
MSTNPAHLADAYIAVAVVDHYLVGVVRGCTLDELAAAEQLLISMDNAVNNGSRVISRALDLMETDRRVLAQSS